MALPWPSDSKYSPQGGPVIINIWEDTVAQAVEISVQDSGIGIPKQQHAQIFGRFMRAENAVAWGISGTGLGLYLCRELIERHEGHLWFESEEGRGSTLSNFSQTLEGSFALAHPFPAVTFVMTRVPKVAEVGAPFWTRALQQNPF